MTQSYCLALAEPSDDAALRALLRNIAMPGEITLSFQREPSFFIAEQAGNVTSQVITYKEVPERNLVGLGSRSIRDVYIDGTPTRVGYLSMLRGLPQVRSGRGLARGYQFLRKLHEDGRVPFYFTTILDDNTYARALLTSKRARLPVYTPWARIVTYLIPLRGNRRIGGKSPHVQPITAASLPQVSEELNTWNSRHQFSPYYTLDDLLGRTALLPNFHWEHCFAFWDEGKVVGTIGTWDQPYKQTVVASYTGKMRAIRPFYNIYASLRRLPGLPRVGRNIPVLYAGFLSAQNNDTYVFRSLLRRVIDEWSNKGYDYLSLGVCEDSSLSLIAAQFATQRIRSTVYCVHWDDDSVTLPDLSVPTHVEIATL